MRPDNSCESFWELLKWAKEEQSDEKVLVVFRTFGTDMPEMFERCEANGFADDVMRAPDGTLPLIWTMMHELPTEDAAEYTPFKSTKDTVVDGAGRELLQPGPPLPGPKEKGTDEFKLRSVGLEDAGTAFFKAGKQLAPFVFTGPPRIERDAGGIPRLATLTTEDVATYVPVPACQALGVNGTLGKMGFENGSKLKIMGVQDNYKPWSRKNWRSGKTVVLPPTSSNVLQMVFDDYSFTKSDAEGCYIQALYDEASGAFVEGDKPSLQKLYSAEAPFCGGEGNTPTIFTALLCKKGKQSAVSDPKYFLSGVQRALKVLRGK